MTDGDVLVTGFDMFFDGVDENLMLEIGRRLSAKVSCDVGCGVLTRFHEVPKLMSEVSFCEELEKFQALGNSMAQEFGGSYSGTEFYIDSCKF